METENKLKGMKRIYPLQNIDVPRPRGRKPLYSTDEERKAARREQKKVSNHAYYLLHTQKWVEWRAKKKKSFQEYGESP